MSIVGASNGTGSYLYKEKSEKNTSDNESTDYINIDGTTITLLSNTPPGTYAYVVTVTDNGSEKTKDATITLTVAKMNMEAPNVTIDNTDGTITWDDVIGATSYEISFDNTTWEAATSGENKIDQSSAGVRTAYVRAVTNHNVYNKYSSVGSASITVYSLQLNKVNGIDSVENAGNYFGGTTVDISANVNCGYRWNNWTVISGDSPVDSSLKSTQVTITQDTVLKAGATPNKITYKVTGSDKCISWVKYSDNNCKTRSGILSWTKNKTYTYTTLKTCNAGCYYLYDIGGYVLITATCWSQ